VESVMRIVDRGHYTKTNPYVDAPQSIGYNVVISAPHLHARALEYLQDHLHEGSKCLDIGSGTGYVAACMALMVGNTGKVIGIEHMEELLQSSIDNISSGHPHLLSNGTLELMLGDGRHGFLDGAPYDCIHVGASSPSVPQALVDQLKPGGRIIMPIGPYEGGQQLEQLDKLSTGIVLRKPLLAVRYVPLTDQHKQWPEQQQQKQNGHHDDEQVQKYPSSDKMLQRKSF